MHGLRCGSPEDLKPFTEKLSRGGVFRDDMQSMVRSIIFREGGGIPRTELLRIVTVAVGGPDVDGLARDVVGPVQTILKFLSEVMRVRWGMSETEADEDREAVSEPFETPEPPIVIPIRSDRPYVESSAVEAEMEAYGHSSLYCESMLMYPEPVTPGGRVREFPMPLSRHASPVAEKQDEGVLFPWMKQPWARIAALCVVMLSVLAIALLGRSRAAGDAVSKATDPVVSPYDPPAAATTPAQASHVAAATGTKSTASRHPVRGGRQDGRVRVAGVSSAVVGTDSQDEYTGTAAGPTVVTPPAAGGEFDARHPAAPIYRVTPTTTELRPVNPASASPMAATGARSSSRSPAYNPHVWLPVSPVAMARNLISAPAPGYPKLAGLMHLEGKVVLRAVVDREGNVIETEVLRGHHLLRGAARDAVQRWRYRPYLLNGRPMEVATVVTVDFERK